MPITPEQFPRRSFVYPRLVSAGARFVDIGDAAVAAAFPESADPALGLTDLSPLQRTGVKGPRALAWLQESGWPVPERNNSARRTDGGALVARLGDHEALVLAAPTASRKHGREVHALEQEVPGADVWQVPRRDSHCWFALRGADAIECLQKLCGIDLRSERFPPGTVAQTSVARLNAIVCRGFDGDAVELHLLADSASATWFWDALLDAMRELDGGPLGLRERPRADRPARS